MPIMVKKCIKWIFIYESSSDVDLIDNYDNFEDHDEQASTLEISETEPSTYTENKKIKSSEEYSTENIYFI